MQRAADAVPPQTVQLPGAVDVAAADNQDHPRAESDAPCDDRAATLKLKNRLAQQRSRAKVRAELAVVEKRVAVATHAIADAATSLPAKRQQLRAVRERLVALSADLRSVADRLQHELLQSVLDGRAASSRTPARPPQPRASPIFRPPRGEGAPLPHAAAISIARLPSGGALVHRLQELQAREAGRLGCGVADVAWLYECSFRESVTRDAPIPSNLPSPGCQAHMLVPWMAARLECAMLLAMWTRVDRASAALPFEQPFASGDQPGGDDRGEAQAHGPQLASDAGTELAARFQAPGRPPTCAAPRAGAPVQIETQGASAPADADVAAAAAAADPIEELSDKVFGFFLGESPSDAPLRPPAPSHPPSPRERRPTQLLERWNRPDALSSFVALVRRALGDIFEEYVPQMHPADVVQLCKRLAAAFEAKRPEEREPLTAKSGVAALFAEVVALARKAGREARINPPVPALPATQEAAARRKAELEARMDFVYTDWTLFYVLIAVGCPVWAQQACIGFNPASTAELAKAEQQNLKAYVALALSTEQKRAVKAGMRWYRTRRAQLAAETAAVAAELDAALSAAEAAPQALSKSRVATITRPLGARSAVEESQSVDRTTQRSPAAQPVETRTRARSAPRCGAASRPPQRPRTLRVAAERRRCQLARRPPAAPPGAHEAFAWARRLLGACPEATEAASDALDALRCLHMSQHQLYVEALCAFKFVLTPRQQAVWLTGQLPFVPDSHRVADMAATDLCCDRVYGVPSLRGPLG